MKPLLTKTTRPFLIYVLIILVISVPVYYLVIDAIWKYELDEHNDIIIDKTIQRLNELNLTEAELQNSIELWDKIQPNSKLQEIEPGDNLNDSIYTVEYQHPFNDRESLDRFRCLSKIVKINGKSYRFTAQTNIEETGETIGIISLVTAFFFLLIVVGLLFLTRKLSASAWKPFYKTLEKLKSFNLNNQSSIAFEESDTTEFSELNQSLQKLIEHNVSVFKSQKEFTENASHELQTPLAILKSKLDILLQNEDLTETQYHIAEEMNRSLNRSSRINKNLLLLAKIDNYQFDDNEKINVGELVQQIIDSIQEHFDQKKIRLQTNLMSEKIISGNRVLTEILIHNLLLNAIRYTPENGQIAINLVDTYFQIQNSGTESLNPDFIFKRFSKQTSDRSGSGLGLSIVEKISQFHHWKVNYQFLENQHIFTVNF